MSEHKLVSDQERGNFKIGQEPQESPEAAIARKNRDFEAQQASKQRREIAQEIIETQKREKVTAAKNRLLEMLESGHQVEVQDFTDGLTQDDREALINSLKEPGDPADEDELSPEARKIVDDVMAKK